MRSVQGKTREAPQGASLRINDLGCCFDARQFSRFQGNREAVVPNVASSAFAETSGARHLSRSGAECPRKGDSHCRATGSSTRGRDAGLHHGANRDASAREGSAARDDLLSSRNRGPAVESSVAPVARTAPATTGRSGLATPRSAKTQGAASSRILVSQPPVLRGLGRPLRSC